MAISTGPGGTASVGLALNEGNRTPSATYAALAYTEILGVETWSEFGVEGAVVNFTPLKDGVTRQVVGAINPGTWTLTCADDPLDPGQIAMKANVGTRRLYPIKLVTADGADNNDIDSSFYFGVRILSAKRNKGQAGISMIVFACALDTPIHEIPSTAVTGGT